MNRVFRVLASCVFAVIIAFGTLVGGAFAQTTPDPSEFSLIPTGGQLVKLSPQIQSFTVLYDAPNFQSATIKVDGGTCNSDSITVPRGSVGYSKTYSCGQASIVFFQNEGPGIANARVSQVTGR